MNSKKATVSATNRAEGGTPIPELRFPGFRGPWVVLPMSALYSFHGSNSLSRDKLNYEGGSYKNIHYGDIHTKFSLHFVAQQESVPFINSSEPLASVKAASECSKGDMVFADASEDIADIGKAIEIIDAGDTPLVAGLHTILARPTDASLARGFGAYLFSSVSVKRQIQREAQGAKVLGLSATRLAKVMLQFPRNVVEQQKIGGCLGSIDSLIKAERNVVESLRDYKKGLMQRLFPRVGEAIPRLRFPEFRNSDPWVELPMAEMLQGAARPVKMHDDQEYTLVTVKRRYGGIVLRNSTRGRDILVKSQFQIAKDDFLISKRQIVHSACAVVPEEFDGAIVSNEYTVLRARDVCDIHFMGYFSQQPVVASSFLECSAGVVLEKMLFKPEQWLRKAFRFPQLAEQRKIAATLSAIDQRIGATAHQIAALERHKDALVQKLFPRAAGGSL